MTPEQIKAAACLAGAGEARTPNSAVTMFVDCELAEFVRLVRQQAFDEAAEMCRELADCEENTGDYRHGAAWCEARIRSLK